MRALLVLLLSATALRCAHVEPPQVSAATETPSPTDDARILGRWQASGYSSGSESYLMDFQTDGFRAEHGDEWYTGTIHLDPATTPARIDFAIEDTNGSWGGQTSTGIYRWDGETLMFDGTAAEAAE